MCGFSREQTHIVQIMSTKGEIRGNMEDNSISIYDFLTKEETVIKFDNPIGGHGGGDKGIMRTFLNEIDNGTGESVTSAEASERRQHMAFAAEESRLKNVESNDLGTYYKEIELRRKVGVGPHDGR